MKPTPLELLAPARNVEIARTAILCGADAVYIGAPAFGARAAATNPVSEIEELCAFAHIFGVRVYVTMNTILYDSELEAARNIVWELYNAGVDALIVQDMAYLMMDLPPIALHASTQCDIRTPEKARMLADAGFSQLVLPREFTPEQIRRVRQAAGVPVEVFIHGARCVSYSGDCQMGFVATGRSANRGTCPQMCRLPFELIDDKGRAVGPVRHYLSLSDMRTDNIGTLIEAGATSFKIEGRLKDARYVANAVAAYSRALDQYIAEHPRYCRASSGKSAPGFEPDLDKEFFRRPNGGGTRATLASPKDTGSPAASVIQSGSQRSFSFKGTKLTNGDGLGFFTPDGEFHGFRLNRVDGNRGYAASDIAELKPGMKLYKNFDKEFTDTLDAARPVRTLTVNFTLEPDENGFKLTAESGKEKTSVKTETPIQNARTPQTEPRLRLLSRLGDTNFELGTVTDKLGDTFIPASVLTAARRQTLDALEQQLISTHQRDHRRPSALTPTTLAALPPLTYHDNVANHLAQKFYTTHGATVAQKAIEVEPRTGEVRVMQTPYCIRAELGACLKEKNAATLPRNLYLRNTSGTYRIDTHCPTCTMTITKLP